MLLYIKITFQLQSIAITYLQYLIIFFSLILFFVFCSIFFSPTDSCFSRWKLTNLNNFPNSVDISLSRLWQKRSCTRQMQFSMNIFQVDTKFITTAYSQPMNPVQTEPELTVQVAKTAFVMIPSAKEINRAISPLLLPAVFWSQNTV